MCITRDELGSGTSHASSTHESHEFYIHTKNRRNYSFYFLSIFAVSAHHVRMWKWTDARVFLLLPIKCVISDISWVYLVLSSVVLDWTEKKCSIGFYILITCLFIPIFEIGAHQFGLWANSFFYFFFIGSLPRSSWPSITTHFVVKHFGSAFQPLVQHSRLTFVLIKWIIIVYLPLPPSCALWGAEVKWKIEGQFV